MMYTVMNRPIRPNDFARPDMMMHRMMRDMCMPPRPHHRPPMGFPVDVQKTDAAYILTAELPGVKLEDIAITVENDVLTIAAERKPAPDQEGMVMRERRWGRVERRFSLEGIDQAGITAACADGILTVTLPKEKPEGAKALRHIPIVAPVTEPVPVLPEGESTAS